MNRENKEYLELKEIKEILENKVHRVLMVVLEEQLFEYLSDTNNQSEEDPGNRKVRFNNTTLNSSTKIYIDSNANVGGFNRFILTNIRKCNI